MSPIAANWIGTPSRPLAALFDAAVMDPQLGDPVAWLNLTLAEGRELDDVALHPSPVGGSPRDGAGCTPSWQRWWDGRCTERLPRRTIASGTRQGIKLPDGRR